MSSAANRLSELVTRGDTIMFVGSGVSVWSGLPTWGGLLDKLAYFIEARGKSSELLRRELANKDFLLAASFGFDTLSRQERCEFIRGVCLIDSAVPSPLHHAIARLNTRCFITTNYDALLERALSNSRPNEHFDVVTSLQQLEIASIVQARSEGFVFKPHGDVGSCDSIVLTREDYRTLHDGRRNVLEAMRTLLASRPVIFIGFGLRDPDFLLIRDLISASFGTHPSDHYALMPDVIPEEAEYWRRNYGLQLVPYESDSTKVGAERHHRLLDILGELVPLRRPTPAISLEDQTSQTILNLARHARRLLSTIPLAEEETPLLLGFARQGEPERADIVNVALGGRHASKSLLAFEGKVILEGPPGSGKSYTVQQVARGIALRLENECLNESPPKLTDLRVPVTVSLRDYSGDLFSMIKDALPVGINLEELFESGSGVFFLDGANEVPTDATEENEFVADLSRHGCFKISSCGE